MRTFLWRSAMSAALLLAPLASAQITVKLPLVSDAWISNGADQPWNPTANYGSMEELHVSGTNDRRVAVLAFPTATLPTGTIQSVKLRLFVTGATLGYAGLYLCTVPWLEAEATWRKPTNNATDFWEGATTSAARGAKINTFAVFEGPIEIPLGYGVVSNYNGIIIDAEPPGSWSPGSLTLASSESTNFSKPELVVTFDDQTTASVFASEDTTLANASDPASWVRTGPLRVQEGLVRSEALLKFDVSPIPPAAKLESARLVLTPHHPVGASFGVFEMKKPWVESAVTWLKPDSAGSLAWTSPGLSPGADRDTVPLASVPPGSGTLTASFTSEGLNVLQGWLSWLPNHGMVIVGPAGGGADELILDAREDPLLMPPELEVDYYDSTLKLFSAPVAPLGSPSAPLVAEVTSLATQAVLPDQVVLKTDSPLGSFATSPAGPWATSLTLRFSALRTPPFYYRDGLYPSVPRIELTSPENGAQPSSVPVTLTPHLFEDDFETGGLLAGSGGRWTEYINNGATTLSLDPAAAHRGGSGLKVVDADPAAPAGALIFRTAPLRAPLYVRAWVRLAQSNGTGSYELVALANDEVPRKWLASFGHDVDTGRASLGGDIGGSVSTAATQASSGEWHLVELAVTGLGTTGGERALYVDGQRLLHQGSLDLSGVAQHPTVLLLGQPRSSGPEFQGALHFDDVRYSAEPHPSTLRLTGPSAPAVGACEPVAISLVDSEGRPAPAPEALDLELLSPGGVYADVACATATSSAAMALGTSAATVYFKATAPGATYLRVLHPDYLEGRLTMEVGGAGLTLTPASATVAPGAELAFLAQGGVAPYRWTLEPNGSGGSLSPEGRYRAGPGFGRDVVLVTDQGGLSASAEVDVVGVELSVALDGPAEARPVGSRVSGTLTVTARSALPQVSLVLEGSGLRLESLEGEGLGPGCGDGCWSLDPLAPDSPQTFAFGARLEARPGSEAVLSARVEAGAFPLASGEARVAVVDFNTRLGCGCAGVPASPLWLLCLAWLTRRRARGRDRP